MSGNTLACRERLYLSKEPGKELYIDLQSILQQHHLDGIRFLFKQFIKKNPGVILNDPVPTEHILQVVLFLNAIRKFLTGRILIICNSCHLHLWSQCFREFPDILDETAIDVATPALKKSIFVVDMEQVRSFCNREWGVIVVQDDEFLAYKDLDKNFKAEYKIFMTSFSMKDNLQKFSTIYKWFYPKEKLDIEEFKTSNNNISDIVAKTVKFQAFVEDIVIGRSIVLGPPEAYKELPPENRVRKKNKDATGTKIKRSKRKIEDNTDVPILDSKIHLVKNNGDSEYEGIAALNSSDYSISKRNTDVAISDAMDVESFIRDQEPIQSDEFRDYVSDCDDSPQKSDRTELDEKYAIKIGKLLNTSDCDVKGNTESMHLHYSEDVSQSLLNDEDDSAYLLETQVDNEMQNNVYLGTSENALKDIASNGESIVSIEQAANDNQHETNKIDLTPRVSNEIVCAEVTKNESEVKNTTEVDDKETKGIKQLESPKKDINTKLLEMEEKIMKKFKGSLLDQIF